MEAPTDRSSVKYLVQFIKQALHSCLARRGQEDRRLSPSSSSSSSSHLLTRADFLRSNSAYFSPLGMESTERAAGGDPGSAECCCTEEEEEEEEADCCDDENMTFQRLPYECKLKIFSFLGAMERGMAERVCRDWRDVLRSPTLWTDIDLSLSSSFQRKVVPSDASQSTGGSSPTLADFKTKSKPEAEAEFDRYKSCVAGYVEYLGKIRPCVRSLSFSFDIGDSPDGWTQLLKNFLDFARTKNTRRATFNWKDTSAKPSALLDSSNTWSTGNYSDLMYKQRRRQRLFVSFFDSFTALVPNLESLSLPFDWSSSSVAHLTRLGPTLTELTLEEYFVPQPLEQWLLDRLLASLPNLEHLSVGLVLGSGLGMSGYEFGSPSLRSLDLSKCQGFALTRVDLPNLKELRISNASFPSQLVVMSGEVQAPLQNAPGAQQGRSKPTRQARTSSSFSSSNGRHLKSSKSLPSLSSLQSDTQKLPVPSGIPCLFNVLKRGAPSLERLNNYKLLDDWRETFDSKLEKILHQACPCLYHHQYHAHLTN